MFMLLSQDYTGTKQKLYKTIIIQMLATWGKAKPSTKNMMLKFGDGEAYSRPSD
jgi:hypothetical protein